MTLGGPRPELIKYVEQYEGEEKNILQVRPGITDFSSVKFISLGCKVVNLKVSRHGKNILQDMKLINDCRLLIKKYKPDIVLTYTVKPNSKSFIAQQYKHNFEDKILYLYYLSTSQSNQIIESDLITTRLEEENYIPFLFEVKHNSPDKQIYEGKVVLEFQHAYFYFRNKSRNERGLIITYLYPLKNKDTPFTLLGLMVSISHGSEQRPCSQKCFITSQKVDSEVLKPFLKMDTPDDSCINNDFLITLSKSSDRQIYDLINNNLP